MSRTSFFFRALVIFILMATALPSWAQSRGNTGRHKASTGKPSPDKVTEPENDPSGRWMIEVNGGLFGGGDLFSATHTTGDTIAWDHGNTRDLVSHRIRVGLKNSFGGGVQIQRRMNNWYSLRAGLSYSKMDLMAEAPVGESAEVFKYDQADVLLLNFGGEIRLTNTNISYPYFTLDVVYLDFSPVQSEFLSQSNMGGRLGLGYHYQFTLCGP